MSEKQISFIDERYIDQAYRLKREAGRPVMYKDDPVLMPGSVYGSVLKDKAGNFKMWYSNRRRVIDKTTGSPFNSFIDCSCFAESSNGIEWESPHLNKVSSHPDITDRTPIPVNAFLSGSQFDQAGRELCGRSGPEGFCVIDSETDPHPSARARYTAMYLSTLGDSLSNQTLKRQTRGICFAYSDDGINWSAYPENPVIEGWMDNNNCFFYDPKRKKYLLFGRPDVFTGLGSVNSNRLVGRAESEDLIHWSPYKRIFETDDRDADPFMSVDETQLQNYWSRYYGRPDLIVNKNEKHRGRNRQHYGITVFPSDDIYIGFLQVYDVLTGGGWLELVHSYDSIIWRRELVPIPFIGPRPGYWDGVLTLFAFASPPVPNGDDLMIYYQGGTRNHHQRVPDSHGPDGIGLKTIKKGRFVGYRAAEYLGELITIPVDTFDNIFINAEVGDMGEVRVGLSGPHGEMLDGFDFEDCRPIKGNGLRLPVMYRNDAKIKEVSTGQMRIRIRLKDAAVYGSTLV